MERNIWCLWEPPGTLPGYLACCLRTIERNAGAEVHLLTAADVEQLAPEMRPDLAARIIKIGQRSDYYRSHLLAAQGGLWLDIDIVVMRDLSFAFDAIDRHDLITRRSVQGHASTNFLGAPPQSPIVLEWIRRQTSVIQALAPGEIPPWLQLGGTTLTESLGAGSVHMVSTSEVAPLPWTQAHLFLSRYTSPDVILEGDPLTVMLYNAEFPNRLRALPEEKVMHSSMMVSRLLRVALGKSSIEEERRPSHPVGRAVEQGVRLAGRTMRRFRRAIGS